MTQTLRRELIQIITKDINDYFATSQNYLGETVSSDFAGKLADDILKVSGIVNSPVNRKYSDPNWDLLHGREPQSTEFSEREQLYKKTAERLEKGLLRNEFPQSPDAQRIYRWIADQEAKGESLDTWIKWAMDGNRANYSYVYHTNPGFIKRDWVQAFQSKTASFGRKFERLNNE